MSARRRLAAGVVGAALVVAALVGCGADEAGPDAGEPVDGRAPTMPEQPSTSDSSGSSSGSSPSSEPASSSSTSEPADDPGPLADVAISLTPVAQVDTPTKLLSRPESDLLYVAEQVGRVVIVDPAAGEDAEPSVALDLTDVTRSGGEQGLLGLAFSLDGSVLYVHHSGTGGETRVASFAMDGDVADPASRTDLLTVPQPYANHNGGDLLVDPDGLLWIGLGDGGSADDPEQRAQDPDDLLGKILRVDPTTPGDGSAYSIPEGNMFPADGSEGRPEIAVMGVRNPWRMRFDAETGDLWVADVGQDQLEEIDRLPAGSIVGTNLGWSRWEGSEVFLRAHELGPGALVGPVFEMEHEDGWCSVSGGPLYRGSAVPGLVGAYLFADYCKPGLYAIRVLGEGDVDNVVLDDAVGQVVSIDTDADGEAYVVSQDGTISRIDPA